MTSVLVRPAEGLKVRDEFFPHEPIPAEGKRVERTQHVERRLIAGDLIEITEPTESAEPQADSDEAPKRTKKEAK